MMVSSTYLVALVAVLGSAVTSAHAHRNAGAEIKARLDRRAVGAKGTLGGPAAGCYSLPSDDSFTQPDGNIDIDVNGVTESQPAAYDTYMTADRCALACVPLKKLVVAVAGSECYCGDLYPMKSLQVDDSKCDAKCAGFGDLMCKFTPKPPRDCTDDLQAETPCRNTIHSGHPESGLISPTLKTQRRRHPL